MGNGNGKDSATVSSDTITVHPLTRNPTAAWKEISKTQKVKKVNVKTPTDPVDTHKVRFVCMSDTHSLIHNITFEVPDGDIFIHAGDFTQRGQKEEVLQFNEWLETLPHKHKIVICGNHELSFDEKVSDSFKRIITDEVADNENISDNFRQYLTNCIYLEDNALEIHGIKIYGTPWQPEFGGWAFNLKRGEECLSKWNQIPSDTDILISHGPPLGFGDLVRSGARAGCAELLATVQQRVKPKYHIFGHIHEGYGVFSDGKITYINASTCDNNYKPRNLPIVFDVPLPDGWKKE